LPWAKSSLAFQAVEDNKTTGCKLAFQAVEDNKTTGCKLAFQAINMKIIE